MVRTTALALLVSSVTFACSAPAPLGEASSGLEDGPPPAGSGVPSTPTGTGAPDAPSGAKSTPKLDYQNAQFRAISAAENVTSLATPGFTQGRLRSAHLFFPAPLVDAFGMRVYFMGNPCNDLRFSSLSCNALTFAASFNANWNVGAFTGFTPPGGGAFQFGYRDLTVAPTLENAPNAYQLQGLDAGILINSRTFDHVFDWGAGPHVDYGVVYGNPETPFRHDDGELTLQAQVKVPASIPTGGGAGKISFVATLRDTTSGEGVEIVAKLWDSRSYDGAAFENVGARVNGVTTVSTALLPGGRYATVSPFSSTMRSATTWGTSDFFRVHFSGAQLADVARIIEASTGTKTSQRASDWVLTSAGVRQEVIVGTDGTREMLVGAAYRELSVYEAY